MTAPLSLFLTRFSAPVPPIARAVTIEAPIPEPTVTLTETELAARIEAAAHAAQSDAEQRHSAEVVALVAHHEEALADALAKARVEWAEITGNDFASLIEAKLSELRSTIADRVADVLRPLLVDAVRVQTLRTLTDAIDRLLADPANPALRICGPEDLVASLRAARPAQGIEWEVADHTDLTITAGATHIETQLAAAMAEIATTETSHVG